MKSNKRNRIGIVLFSLFFCSGLLCAVGCDEEGADSVQTNSHAVMTDSLGRELGEVSRQVVEANAEFETTMNLLARVEVEENVMVEFYEPQPGFVVVSGSGLQNAGSSKITGKEMNATDLWNSITRQAQMPEKLRAAIARQVEGVVDDSRFEDMKTLPEYGSSEPVYANQKMFNDSRMARAFGTGQVGMNCLSDYYTRDQYAWSLPSSSPMPFGSCCRHPLYNDWCVCRDRVTGGGYGWARDVENARGNVCVISGRLRYELSGTLPNFGWTVPPNICRWWYSYGMSNAYVRVDLNTLTSNTIYNHRLEVER